MWVKLPATGLGIVLAGVGLIIFPYAASGALALTFIGVPLAALPFLSRYW